MLPVVFGVLVFVVIVSFVDFSFSTCANRVVSRSISRLASVSSSSSCCTR